MKRRRSHIIFYIIWTLVFTLIPLFSSRTEKLSFVDILIAFILSAIISIPVTNNFFNSSKFRSGPPMYYNLGNAGDTRTIAILDFWNGTGHAGTLTWSDGINAVIRDDQTGGTFLCEAWRIRCTYTVGF